MKQFLFPALLALAVHTTAVCQKVNPATSAPASAGASPSVVWKYRAPGGIVATPVVDQNTVYIGSLDQNLYAFNKTSGQIRWKFPTYGPIRSTVCVDGNNLYLLSGDGNLYCLDKNSGKQTWRFRTQTGFIGDRTYDFADYYHSSPVVYNGAIYFGSGDGRVYAVSAAGDLLWSFETGDVVHTVPAFSKGKLFIGSFDGRLYALNAQTGRELWSFKTTGHRYFPRGEVMGNPVVAGNLVLVGARDYNFYAIDADGGYCHWLKSFPRGWALPVTPNDSVVYLGTSEDRSLLAIDPQTGETRWQAATGFNVFGGCAISATTAYFGTLMGKVRAVNLKDGAPAWTFNLDACEQNHLKYFKPDDGFREDIGDLLPAPDNILDLYRDLGAVFSTPALDGGLLFVTGYDGMVYCLKII